MGQRLPLDGGQAGGGLHRVLFHEFQPGRGVVKEVPDQQRGPHGTARLLPAGDHAPLQGKRGAQGVLPPAGEQLHPGHRGDGGQSLSPEAQGADGFQIVLAADLGRGVAEKGGLHLPRRDAAAVVGDPDEGHATALDLHGDGMGTGIHCVFHQLLHHGCRAFHPLAGGDKVGHMGGKLFNMGHKDHLAFS